MNWLTVKALFVVMVVSKSVLAASVSSPCTDPCGGSIPVPGTHGPRPSNLNFTQALQNLLTSALEVKSQADLLVRKYTNASSPQIRISSNTADTTEDSHIVPYSRTNYTNVTEALQNDFNDVTTFSVFVANIHKNERDGNTAVKFSHLMDDLEGALDATLCKIKVAAQARGDNLVCTVTYNDMPSKYRDISITASRFIRDYLVFRDAVTFFTSLTDSYN